MGQGAEGEGQGSVGKEKRKMRGRERKERPRSKETQRCKRQNERITEGDRRQRELLGPRETPRDGETERQRKGSGMRTQSS